MAVDNELIIYETRNENGEETVSESGGGGMVTAGGGFVRGKAQTKSVKSGPRSWKISFSV